MNLHWPHLYIYLTLIGGFEGILFCSEGEKALAAVSIAASVKSYKRTSAQNKCAIGARKKAKGGESQKASERSISDLRSADKSSSSEQSIASNFSEDLEEIRDINLTSAQNLEDFLNNQKTWGFKIAQDRKHHCHQILIELNELLSTEHSFLEAKLRLMKDIRTTFNAISDDSQKARIEKINRETNQKIASLKNDIMKQYLQEVEKNNLVVGPLTPFNIENHFKLPFIQLAETDKKRINDVAKKIMQILLKLMHEKADLLISSRSNDSARLGSYRHRCCQKILEGIQESNVFKGINLLRIEKTYTGEVILQQDQKPDIYWEEGGIVFDYKTGENYITRRDMSVSSQVLPHYIGSFEIKLV